VLSEVPADDGRSPQFVQLIQLLAESASVSPSQIPLDNDQDLLNLVHRRAALPDPAALIPCFVKPVIGMANEPLPMPNSILNLPRTQTGVLESRQNRPAQRRKAREVGNQTCPGETGSLRRLQPAKNVGAKLSWPPTRHLPFVC
jgi:hypothetical protein